MFANVAQSNRVPTVIELGCADPAQPCRLPVGLQSDPFLEQVVSRTVEAGLRWHADDASLSASLYRTVNRNDILFLSTGASQQGYFSNFERTRRQGLDLAASKRFGQFDVRASYNYLEAVFDADGELFTGARNVSVTRGTRMAGLPRHTFKLAVDWKRACRLERRRRHAGDVEPGHARKRGWLAQRPGAWRRRCRRPTGASAATPC